MTGGDGGLEYRIGGTLDPEQALDLYRASTLGERRPIGDRAVFGQMLAHANLVVTAWDGALLVGIARTLTDFGYVAYLADLAVRVTHRRRGIGIELMRRTRAALGPNAMIVLLAAPAAADYYPRVGFTHHPGAWVLRAEEPLPGDESFGERTRRHR